jgi:hypothetical protein
MVVAYVKKCPGHQDSKGNSAPWCVIDHNTDKILSSHASKTKAEEHLHQMQVQKHMKASSITPEFAKLKLKSSLLKKQADKIEDGVYSMPLEEAVDEHRKLVQVLEDPTPEGIESELEEQGSELEEMEQAMEKTASSLEDVSSWTEAGGRQGSNPGGSYRDPSGETWYIKFPKNEDQARNEYAANRIYALANIRVPEVKLVTKDGKVGLASRWIKGLYKNEEGIRHAEDTWKGLGLDILLANWDICGLTYDNLLIDTQGRSVRLDQGGSLRYRAQGAPKGDRFGDTPTELESLRDPHINPESASIFSDLTEDQIRTSLEVVAGIPSESIRRIIQESGAEDGPGLTQRLLKRQKWVQRVLASDEWRSKTQ